MKRIHRRWDHERTELLGQPELFVERGKGDRNYFYGWNIDPDVELCPMCGGHVIKMQDLFSKTYKDLIVDGEKKRVISLEYGFYKWRCLNSKCRHVFAKEIGFATKYNNVTRRLEDEIANKVMLGYTYGEIYYQLQGSVSRQAVGQIFNRWVTQKDECRKNLITPSRLAIVSVATEKEKCVLFINLDDDIRVFDVLYGINSAEISAVIRSLDIRKVETIITDCEEIIVSVAKDFFPNAVHIIPAEFWLRLVTEDFKIFAHDVLKWCSVPGKYKKIMMSAADLGPRISDLHKIFSNRPAIRIPYEEYNMLREIISNRDELWVFNELKEWCSSVCDGFSDYLSVTVMLLDHYRIEIENHVYHRDNVPEQLCLLVDDLGERLFDKRVFSTEVLKAILLYGVNSDLKHWSGVKIDDILQSMTE